MKICKIKSCERKHEARGMCRKHYESWMYNNDSEYRKKRLEYTAKIFQKRKKKKICINCGGKLSRRSSYYCEKHRKYYNKRQRKYHRKYGNSTSKKRAEELLANAKQSFSPRIAEAFVKDGILLDVQLKKRGIEAR